MPDYVVAVRAEADARFAQRAGDDHLVVHDFPTALGPAQLTFRTRFADEGYEAPVPRELWVDVRLTTDGPFKEALNAAGNAGNGLLPLLAFSANAWVGEADVHLAFDATPGAQEREFFENFLPESIGVIPRPGRNISVSATIDLIGALPQEERLMRAVAQYALAVGHWRLGNETLALAHLYMGMDAITPLAVRREEQRLNVTPDELAVHYGIDEGYVGARRTKTAAVIRKEILFRGDDVTHRQAKEASDGFEHGYRDFAEIRADAHAARDATARYLREAILALGGVSEETKQRLLRPPYDEPLRGYLQRYVWGRLLGESDDLAAPDQEYPLIEWRSRLKEFKLETDGTYSMTPEETLTLRLAEGITFQPTGYEAWAPTAGMPPPELRSTDDQGSA